MAKAFRNAGFAGEKGNTRDCHEHQLSVWKEDENMRGAHLVQAFRRRSFSGVLSRHPCGLWLPHVANYRILDYTAPAPSSQYPSPLHTAVSSF